MTSVQSAIIVVLMGVSGSGKTRVGVELAQSLHWPFFDGDQYHPQANIDKMSAGEPLTDSDRQPWLEKLARLIQDLVRSRQSAVIACSALKVAYRQLLWTEPVRFVYLQGSYADIHQRLQQRTANPDGEVPHFMRAEMLASQLADLEEPADALVVDIRLPVADIVEHIIQTLALSPASK